MEEATNTEVELIKQIRKNVSDLELDKRHLETRNLLRFLRARNHHVGQAEQMFRNQIEWRQQHDIDHILEWKIPKEYRRTYWPWHVTGFDLIGNPVAVMPMGLWDPYKIREVTYDVYLRNNFHSLESAWRVLQRQSKGQKTFKQGCLILDFKGMGWRNITELEGLQGTIETFKCFDVNYPETLRVAFIVNTPYVFQIAWKLAQPLLSEHTRSKIKFPSGSDSTHWRKEICQYIKADQFPRQYGGDQPDDTELDLEALCELPWSRNVDHCNN